MKTALPTDPTLLAHVENAKRGHRTALKEVVLALQPRVRNLVRYLVRGDALVDDLTQQSLLTVIERLDSFRGDGRLESWVDGIVLRVTLASMRKQRLRATDELDEAQIAASHVDAERIPDSRKLVHALDSIPFKQRTVLVLHHVLGMSVPEISELESVPLETARSRLRHGMQLLRAAFGVTEQGDD